MTSPTKLWLIATQTRQPEPPFIAEAKALLRGMPDTSERRRIVNLVIGWELTNSSRVNAFVIPEQHKARPASTSTVSSQARAPDRCSYCGRLTDDIQRDHVVAKSRGGSDGDHNRVPACRSCNSKKSDKPFLLWLMNIGGSDAT